MKTKPEMNSKELKGIDALPNEPLGDSLSEKEERESIQKLAKADKRNELSD
jgi:hypothetical protein